MRPRVLLINLPYVVKNIDASRPKIRSFLGFPYGLLSMATYNKDYADIKIIDCDAESNYRASVDRSLQEFKPDIVGFSMMFDSSYKHLSEMLEMVKEFYPHILTILGGAAASYSYEEILTEQKNLDAICYSEGELPLRNLLKPGYLFAKWDLHWDLTHPAWITREKLRNGVAPKIAFIENLDDVIDIDYSLVNPEDYKMEEAFSPYADSKANRNPYFLVTSRGCFGKCTFCSNAKIHGTAVRQASVDKIVAHVKRLVDDYGMKTLIVYDDQLLYKPKRAKELFRQLAQFKIRIEAPNGVSVAFIDKEMTGLMKAAGFDTVYLAIESGSEYVLKELIHKPLKLRMVKPVVKWLQDEGLFCHAFIVCGMPGEEDHHRKETKDFLLDVGVNWAGINLATPVRGSKLYDDCIKNGWIERQKISDIVDKKYIINFPGQTPAEVEKQADEMNISVNFHNNLDMRRGNYSRAVACFRQVLERYPGHYWAKHYLNICNKKLDIVT